MFIPSSTWFATWFVNWQHRPEGQPLWDVSDVCNFNSHSAVNAMFGLLCHLLQDEQEKMQGTFLKTAYIDWLPNFAGLADYVDNPSSGFWTFQSCRDPKSLCLKPSTPLRNLKSVTDWNYVCLMNYRELKKKHRNWKHMHAYTIDHQHSNSSSSSSSGSNGKIC